MPANSIVELKPSRPLKGRQLARLLSLLEDILCIPVKTDCEVICGSIEARVIPNRANGTMRVTYSLGTRWCCSCRSDEADSGACNQCVKSTREWGALRDSPTYRGQVKNWRLSPPRARMAKKKKKAVK